MRWYDLKTLLLVCLVTLTAVTASAAAHPASDLILTYDTSTNQLQATFTHMVSNPATHYIGEVEVNVAGSGQILRELYTSQPTNGTFTYTYPLDIVNGTEITVSGECNLGGEIHRSLIIGQVPTTTVTTMPTETETPTATMTTVTETTTTSIPPTTTQTPGFTGIMAILTLVGIALILYRRR
jgi:hypothetical protein